MLQDIRDRAKGWLAWVIVIIICIPFAFWGINEYFSPAPKRVIAEVNDIELLEMNFQQEMSQRKQELRQLREQERQLRTMLEEQQFQNQEIVDFWFYTMRQIQQRTNETKESVLGQMIAKEVLIQTANNAGMRISDELLAKHIRNLPDFQQNGQFSQLRYEQALRYRPNLEGKIRRELLIGQLSQGILSSVILTDYDQQQHTRLEQQQRSISYLIIPKNRFDDSVTITDADIEAHYQEHVKKQYMTPEKISIEYVELSQDDLISTESIDEKTLTERYQERKYLFVKPGEWKARHILISASPEEATRAELETAEKKAQELLTKIRAGESFEEIAKQFSNDPPSAKKGGELGWFGPGRMVKPFEDAVKAMKIGDVSEPVKSQFGFHIIKLEDIKPGVTRPFSEVREQLEKQLQQEQAEEQFADQVEELARLAFENPYSLQVLTKTFDLEIKSTELFDRNGSNQKDSILSNKKLIDAAFGEEVLKEGLNSELIEIDQQHVVVLRVKDHKPAKAKPLDEVKEQIVTALKREKTGVEAKTLGKNLIDQIKQNGDPDEIVKQHNLNWSPKHEVKRQDNNPKPAIISEAFKMGRPADNKAIYQGIELDDGDYALVALLAIKDGVADEPPTTEEQTDREDTPDPHQRAKEQQKMALGLSEFNQLVSGLKARAEIKEYLNKLKEEI